MGKERNVMKKELTGPAGSSRKKAPREIGPSSAAPRPVEREPEEVVFNHTTLGGVFNRQRDLAASGPRRGRWDLDGAHIEGWVAGVPVVDGVADSGWQECEGGRVRLMVRVTDSPDQKEWVRAMAHGGAYAREVLG